MRTPDALPPGPALPPLLQGLQYIFRAAPFLDGCARRYGECFTLRIPMVGSVVTFTAPEAVREIFTGDEEDLRAGEMSAPLGPLLGANSLLLLDGARHARERRLMLPPFHGERMLAYGETMRAITDRVIERWPIGRPFPIRTEMQAITLDVILRTVFGLEGPETRVLREKLGRLAGLMSNPIWLWQRLQVDLGRFTPWGRFVRLRDEIDRLLFAELARRRAPGAAPRDDVLSLLIAARGEDGQPMSDQELRDEMVTLLLAGHETTATALAWAFRHVLGNPAVYSALRRELAEAGPLTPERVNRLPYLEATIKETLRLNPIISEVGRRLARPMRIGGRELPAGVGVDACIYLVHRRADVWPEPERFDPARFIGTRPSPYEFLPFGGGVRRCLGMAFALFEMKVVLAEILSRVTLRLAPGYRARMVRRSITLAPSAGMPVVVEARAA